MKMMVMVRTTALVAGVMVMAGCGTTYKHSDYSKSIIKNFSGGEYDKPLTDKNGKNPVNWEKAAIEKPEPVDTLLWQLENATVLRTKGDFAKSDAAFEKVRDMYMENLDAAKIRIRDVGDLLTSPANSRYWGTGCDGLMINLYQTLNSLQSGNIEAARVNITRSYLLQQEIVENNAKRIEKEKEAIEKDKNAKQGASNEENQAKVAEFSANAMFDLAYVDASMKAYADYVNPFAVYLDGLFHYAQNDTDRARRSFERVRAFEPDNETVKADHEATCAGQPIRPSVYVIFETGMAPYLTEVKKEIWIPAMTIAAAFQIDTTYVPTYVGVAYPKLVPTPNSVPHIIVTTPKAGATQRVMSMDAVIGKEFENNFPSVMTKAIASTILKTTAAVGANAAVIKLIKKPGASAWQIIAGEAAARALTALITKGFTVADIRSWQTLPKEFQVLRCDMPADRLVALATPDGRWKQNVTVMAGDVVVVYVKSAGSTVSVNQFKLK